MSSNEEVQADFPKNSELDNLLSKSDIILEKNFVNNNDVQNYFSQNLTEIKEFYNQNNLTKISIL
jgi:hypothetical protein